MSSALMRDEDEDGEGEGGFLRHEGFFGFDGFDVEEMDERSLRSSYRSREPTWYKGKQERTSQQGRNITHANSTDGDERHGHAGATTALDMSEARSSSNLLSTSYLRDSYTETRSSLDNLVTQNLPYEIKHDDSRPCVTNPSRTLFGVSSPNIQHLSRKDEVFSLGNEKGSGGEANAAAIETLRILEDPEAEMFDKCEAIKLVRQLGINHDSSKFAFMSALKSDSKMVQSAAMYEMISAPEGFEDQEDRVTFTRILSRNLEAHSEEDEFKAQQLHTIARRGEVVDSYTRGIIEKHLFSRNPAVRLAALAAIKTVYGGPDPSCTERLIRMLKDKEAKVREQAVRTLEVCAAWGGNETLATALLTCLQDSDSGVRRAATDVIVKAAAERPTSIAKAVLRRTLEREGGEGKRTLPVTVQLALGVLDEAGPADAASPPSHVGRNSLPATKTIESQSMRGIE